MHCVFLPAASADRSISAYCHLVVLVLVLVLVLLVVKKFKLSSYFVLFRSFLPSIDLGIKMVHQFQSSFLTLLRVASSIKLIYFWKNNIIIFLKIFFERSIYKYLAAGL